MIEISHFFRWTWLLGAALMGPVALPAGGGQRLEGIDDLTSCEYSAHFFAETRCDLMASPIAFAPILREIQLGDPLRPIRSWQASDGKLWFQVEIVSDKFFQGIGQVKRGWLKV